MYSLQIQPNQHSCLITSFAIATGIPVATLIELIGHDGSKPVFTCGRVEQAFNIQEISFALLDLGYGVIEFAKDYSITNGKEIVAVDFDIMEILAKYPCVVMGVMDSGERHALFWDGWKYYNPNGNIGQFIIEIEMVWVVKKLI